MTERFQKCLQVILRNEGGFVNDKDDPGGATNLGISLRFLSSTGDIDHDGRLDFDLDGDGDIDIMDIRMMNPQAAAKAYHDYFWSPLCLDELNNEQLALQVFDTAVNCSNKTAVKLLQRVCGAKIDGIIGSETISKANTFLDNITRRYSDARKRWYLDLIKHHPHLVKFKAGWMNRVNNTYQKACQFSIK